MAVLIGRKDAKKIYLNKFTISRIYLNKRLLWIYGLIISCFANGFWINDNPWTNKLGWKNEQPLE